MFGCFCGKKRHRPSPANLALDSSGQLQQPVKTSVDLDQEDTVKLETIRQQFTEAQKSQPHCAHRVRNESVVGFVEIPLYRKEGSSLVDAGSSYQLLMYDK